MNLDKQEHLICEALVREIGRAARWVAIVQAWEALLHVRQMAHTMQQETRLHHSFGVWDDEASLSNNDDLEEIIVIDKDGNVTPRGATVLRDPDLKRSTP